MYATSFGPYQEGEEERMGRRGSKDREKVIESSNLEFEENFAFILLYMKK